MKPRAARRAARRPSVAALPAWSGLAIVPKLALSPAACVAARAKRMGGGFDIEPEEVSDRGGRPDRAERAGRVPSDPVVGRRHQRAEATLDLDPDDERRHQRLTGGAGLLGDSERGGQHGSSRVTRHQRVGVIEVERVACRAVDQRSVPHGCGTTAADKCPRPRRRQLVSKQSGQLLLGAAQGTAEPVEHAMPADLDRVRRAGLRTRPRSSGGQVAPTAFPSVLLALMPQYLPRS